MWRRPLARFARTSREMRIPYDALQAVRVTPLPPSEFQKEIGDKLERSVVDFFAMDLREIGKIPRKLLRFCVSKPLLLPTKFNDFGKIKSEGNSIFQDLDDDVDI